MFGRRGAVSAAALSAVLISNIVLAADWKFSSWEDPLNGNTYRAIGAFADTATGNQSWEDDPYMVVRCTRRPAPIVFGSVEIDPQYQVDLFINWDTFVSSDSVVVSYRFGDEESQSDRMGVSTDYDSTFFGRLRSERFISGFVRAASSENKRFVAGVYPYGEGRYTGTWQLDTFVTSVRPVLRYCHVGHWLPPKEVFKGEVQTTITDRDGWLVATFDPSTYLLKVAGGNIRVFKIVGESYTLVYNGTFADKGLDEQGWLVLDLKQEGLAPHVVLYKSGVLRLFEAW